MLEIGTSVRVLASGVFYGCEGTIVRISGHTRRFYWISLPQHVWGAGPWAFEAHELEDAK